MELPQAVLRSERIRDIQESILQNIKADNLPSYSKLINACCVDMKISERTAKEYIKQAMTETHTINDRYGFIVELAYQNCKKPEEDNTINSPIVDVA